MKIGEDVEEIAPRIQERERERDRQRERVIEYCCNLALTHLLVSCASK